MTTKLKVSNTKKLKMLLFLKQTLKLTNNFMCNVIKEKFLEFDSHLYKLEDILPELDQFYPKPSKLHNIYGMDNRAWGTDLNLKDADGKYHTKKEIMYIWNYRKKAVDKAIKVIKAKMSK